MLKKNFNIYYLEKIFFLKFIVIYSYFPAVLNCHTRNQDTNTKKNNKILAYTRFYYTINHTWFLNKYEYLQFKKNILWWSFYIFVFFLQFYISYTLFPHSKCKNQNNYINKEINNIKQKHLRIESIISAISCIFHLTN